MPASWLTAAVDPQSAAIARAALAHVGECEEPPTSNRGPMVDRWNIDRGAPVGSFWCASFAAAMWAACGAATAGKGLDPSCDALMHWCTVTGRFSLTPTIGAFIFYGIPGDARHVGIVVRTSPYLCTVEGNAAWGGVFTRNGEAVVARRIAPDSANILGYGAVRAPAQARAA